MQALAHLFSTSAIIIGRGPRNFGGIYPAVPAPRPVIDFLKLRRILVLLSFLIIIYIMDGFVSDFGEF